MALAFESPSLAKSRPRWAMFSRESERAHGAELAGRLNRSLPVLEDAQFEAYLSELSHKIAARTDVGELRIHIIAAPYLATFYVHGGYLYYTTALLSLCENESELAALIAHPVAHLQLRHWARRQTRNILLSYATVPLMAFLPYTSGAMVPQAGTLMMDWYVNRMPESEEREADALALDYLADAGYSPAGAATIARRVGHRIGENPAFAPLATLLACIPGPRRLAVLEGELKNKSDGGLVSTSGFADFRGALIAKIVTASQAAQFRFACGIETPEDRETARRIEAEYKRQIKQQAKARVLSRIPPAAQFAVRAAGFLRHPSLRLPGTVSNDAPYGQTLRQAFEAQNRTFDDARTTEYLTRLAANLGRANGFDVPFAVTVTRSQSFEAEAFPGGFIYISTGALLALESEAQVAAVLAHEMAHVEHRDWRRGLRREALWQWGPVAPLLFTDIYSSRIKFLAVGSAWTYGQRPAMNEFTRHDESRADALAIRYLAGAGYDPFQVAWMLAVIQDREHADRHKWHLRRMDHPPTNSRFRKAFGLATKFSREQRLLTASEFDDIHARVEGIIAGRILEERSPSPAVIADEGSTVPPVIGRREAQ